MKKVFLILFILLDIGLIAGSGYVLMTYLKQKKLKTASAPAAVVAQTSVAPGAAPAPSAPVKPGVAPVVPASSGAADSNVRKILFTYRNSKAQLVSIRSDFTGWKAEPMQKGAAGAWTYMAHLTPGEYAYCFTVGDKIINDPANKRTKVIGRTTVSSIVVEALPAKPAK